MSQTTPTSGLALEPPPHSLAPPASPPHSLAPPASSPHHSPVERTSDLSSLDIDLEAVFDRLLSPKGIVQQFLLSVTLQIFNIIGFIVSGLGYGVLLERAPPGPMLEAIQFFGIVLTPQVV